MVGGRGAGGEGGLYSHPATGANSQPRPVADQIAAAARQLQQRGVEKFIAYFQPGTNTFGPLDRLRGLFEEAMAQPGVVGLAIGTRPDCVRDEVLDLLAGLAAQTWLVVEYGLQSIHQWSLDWLGRGHDYAAFVDAVQRSHARGVSCGAHVILGLPGETLEDMQATAAELGRLGVHSVKLHNLYAARGTRLADLVAAGRVDLGTRDDYVRYAVGFLEALDQRCVVERLCSSVTAEYLVGPPWALDSGAIRMAIEDELRRRNTWQGRLAGRGHVPPNGAGS